MVNRTRKRKKFGGGKFITKYSNEHYIKTEVKKFSFSLCFIFGGGRSNLYSVYIRVFGKLSKLRPKIAVTYSELMEWGFYYF